MTTTTVVFDGLIPEDWLIVMGQTCFELFYPLYLPLTTLAIQRLRRMQEANSLGDLFYPSGATVPSKATPRANTSPVNSP